MRRTFLTFSLLFAGLAFGQGRPAWGTAGGFLSLPPICPNVTDFSAAMSVYPSDAVCFDYPTCSAKVFYNAGGSKLQSSSNWYIQGYLSFDGLMQATNYASSTGTPGNATLNRTIGRSAIAAAATQAVITNSVVDSDDVVVITPEDIDVTCTRWKVTSGSGSFTVECVAAATATFKFNWIVVKN